MLKMLKVIILFLVLFLLLSAVILYFWIYNLDSSSFLRPWSQTQWAVLSCILLSAGAGMLSAYSDSRQIAIRAINTEGKTFGYGHFLKMYHFSKSMAIGSLFIIVTSWLVDNTAIYLYVRDIRLFGSAYINAMPVLNFNIFHWTVLCVFEGCLIILAIYFAFRLKLSGE